MKNIRVLSENFQFLEGKFSIYILKMHNVTAFTNSSETGLSKRCRSDQKAESDQGL